MASFTDDCPPTCPPTVRPSIPGPGPGLGLGLGLGAGAGAGISLGGGLRPTKDKKVAFAEKNFDPNSEVREKQWKMAISSRMRFLDDVHKHVPLPEECKDLNIPDDRLDLHRTQDIMFIAGGCAGVRFSTEEMALIGQLRSELQPTWDEVDNHFQKLDSATRKRILNGGPYASSCQEYSEGDQDAEAAAVISFHRCADKYLEVMHRLHILVRTKQATIRRGGDGEIVALPKFDKDPDGNLGKAMPDWLSILLTKFQRDRGGATSTVNAPSSSSSSLKAGVTVGKFAAYLSACVVGSIACTDEEWNAVSQLLHASNDSHTVFTLDGRILERGNAPIDESSSSSSSSSSQSQNSQTMQPKPQSYWASRFFSFLTALSELKTIPKDEKSLLSVS